MLLKTKLATKVSFQIAIEEQPKSRHRPAQRARKRLWTAAEDVELEKGFRLHGYNWNAMVKDAELHFDGRSGGQIRDRFRLKYKSLYKGQDVIDLPTSGAARFELSRSEQPSQKPDILEKSNALSLLPENDDRHVGDHGKAASKIHVPSGLINGDDEDGRLSKSILHDDLDWVGSLTLPPLTWEDMATRPIFSFD